MIDDSSSYHVFNRLFLGTEMPYVFFFLRIRHPPNSTLFPYTTLFRSLRNGGFGYSMDRDFAAVIDGCAAPRAASPGTWITCDMRAAYLELHRLGHAHSIEIWRGAELLGGLYGVRLGGVFFGESMFSRARDASKAALAHLVAVCRRNTLAVIDCQLPSRHLTSLGSRTIPRSQFQALLREHVRTPSAALAPP